MKGRGRSKQRRRSRQKVAASNVEADGKSRETTNEEQASEEGTREGRVARVRHNGKAESAKERGDREGEGGQRQTERQEKRAQETAVGRRRGAGKKEHAEGSRQERGSRHEESGRKRRCGGGGLSLDCECCGVLPSTSEDHPMGGEAQWSRAGSPAHAEDLGSIPGKCRIRLSPFLNLKSKERMRFAQTCPFPLLSPSKYITDRLPTHAPSQQSAPNN